MRGEGFNSGAGRCAASPLSDFCWPGAYSSRSSFRSSACPCGCFIRADMRMHTHRLQVSTRGKGLYEITSQIASWLSTTGAQNGLLTVFVQHTSASLTIQENADPDVME